MEQRLLNGVRTRMDGAGDLWADQHREELGNRSYLNDIDGFAGLTVWASHSEDHLFVEYEPDSWEYKDNVIRRFGTIAFFDRKKSRGATKRPGAPLSLAYHLDLCRQLGKSQPIAPRFFYVFGEGIPWELVEINIENGSSIGHPIMLVAGSWSERWRELGLVAARDEIRRWLATT
jgi:hypothetical protein